MLSRSQSVRLDRQTKFSYHEQPLKSLLGSVGKAYRHRDVFNLLTSNNHLEFKLIGFECSSFNSQTVSVYFLIHLINLFMN